MVQVAEFWIDSTEVTVGQYKQFLAAKGNDTSGQPSVCAWNTSYYNTTMYPFFPDAYPIGAVDWCDAQAFCTWAGKHLCGRRGGGPITIDNFYDPLQSQWFLACGGPNGATHPNGNATCNDNSGSLAIAGATATCEGFYPGIFDMQGNIAEWVDTCVPGDSGSPAGDICNLMGGNYIQIGLQDYCSDVPAEEPRNALFSPFGFRCCGG
jgi:formylglycine-generating enzyme required for sulfatase activity